ncbi:hypothetical protein GCM10010280_31560 [Streptomyces pilosus]|uniref:Uncharacterized protein n=1 Tax=Streptomyces pilosus TaxID=28893 RepID=A0A918BNR0_9ACTN|nr:hypothetical protein GCM10010280_31560 [Streptomyces pilosus]
MSLTADRSRTPRSRSRAALPVTTGAGGDRKVTGYADLSEGSDLSTFRVIASGHQQTGDPS